MSRTTIEQHEVSFNAEKDLKAVGDQIIMKVVRNEKTVGGLILPKGEKTSSCIGKVISVGHGYTAPKTGELFPLPILAGDHVVTMEYMGHRMELRSGDYRIVREHGIWCMLYGKFDNDRVEVTTVVPYNGKILVNPIVKEKTDGGIFLPSDPKTQFQFADVVTVGYGWRDMDYGNFNRVEVSGGDRVVMRRYAGSQITVKGKELRIIDRQDVLAVVEE